MTTTDWAATGAMLQGLGTIGGALAVIGAAWFGASTFQRWRQQKLSERRIEQAERILTATYKVRRQLSFVRSPAMWNNELDAAEAKLKESDQWAKAGGDNERKKLTTAQAYYTRIYLAKDDRQALDECLPMARALFGERLEQALDKLNRQFWTVQVAVDAILRDREGLNQPFREKMDRVVWEGSAGDDDVNEVDETIKEQVKTIEDICVPVLRLESDGKRKRPAVSKVSVSPGGPAKPTA